MRLGLFCMFAAAALPAQQGSVGGPVAGWVFDPAAHALRPVRGTPGAAVIAAPVPGSRLTEASVSPRLDSAIATDEGGSVHFFRIRNGGITERPIDGSVAPPRAIVYSPSGQSAALIAGTGAAIVTGLPDAPAISGRIEMGAGLGRVSSRPLGRFTAALSDDGAWLLVAAAGSATLFSTAGEQRRLDGPGHAEAVAFAPHVHDAAVGGSKGVALFPDVAVPGARIVLGRGEESPGPVTSLAFSADGSRIFAAGGGLQGVAMFDRSGLLGKMPCNCAPSALAPMGDSFRLTDLGKGPLWLLDAGAADPRIVFVPALSAD